MTTLMTTDHAGYILRRKPSNRVEHEVARTALLVLMATGMDQASIEHEVGRVLTYPEMLVVEGF